MGGRPEIIVPGSTSNLGASFDACGLALSLYLKTVVVELGTNAFQLSITGEGAESLPHDESNLIVRVARTVAAGREREIQRASLRIHNEIPLARGLGSSSAAIITGITLYEVLSGETLTQPEILRLSLEFEEHPDNLAPELLGGLVVACVSERGPKVITVKRAWPDQIRIVLAIPSFEMETARMRSVLPAQIRREDAIFNLQRAALLQAALAEGRFDLLSETLRDRLHQPYRVPLAPGLERVLELNDECEKHPGLLGVALSGAGSTMIAFTQGNTSSIATEMRERFLRAGVEARTIEVKADNTGRVLGVVDEPLSPLEEIGGYPC